MLVDTSKVVPSSSSTGTSSARKIATGPQSSSSSSSENKKKLPLETAYDKLPEMRLNPQMVQRNPIDTSLKRTTAGVDVSDPNLYVGKDYQGDSSTATVMGMATGYGLSVYQRFVGSLRKSGFQGHIILGVSPDVSQEVLKYFAYRNVTPKIPETAPCTFKAQNKEMCAVPYLDIKTRWSRYPLQADWLRECPTCTGPILTVDVRDTFFQRDPFGPGSPVVKGLQVFEEYAQLRTTHWLTDHPFKTCKGIQLDEVMLCSGSTIGTRAAMLKYFEVMYAEMKEWCKDPACYFDGDYDDQTIHDYLYYSGQLPFATAWPNRGGGIVNTVGVQASEIFQAHEANIKKTQPGKDHNSIPFPGAIEGKTFLGVEFNLTNEDGWFTDFDGSVSRVIHQVDRFGPLFDRWLESQDIGQDPLPAASP